MAKRAAVGSQLRAERERQAQVKKELTDLLANIRKLSAKLSGLDHWQPYYQITRSAPRLRTRMSQLKQMLEALDVDESRQLAVLVLRDIQMCEGSLRALAPWAGAREPRPKDQPDSRPKPPEAERRLFTFAGSKTRRLHELASALLEDLEALHSQLADRMKRGLTPQERRQLGELAKRQRKLREQAGDLKASAQNLAKMSPVIGGRTPYFLERAEHSMGAASEGLDGRQPSAALSDEREALRALSRAKDELSQAGERLQKGMMAGGMPLPFSLRGGPGFMRYGMLGARTGKVDLPSPDEYKVPARFRDDIIDAMKDGLPSNYRALNKEYYRVLVE